MIYGGYFRNIKNEPIAVVITTQGENIKTTMPYQYNKSTGKVTSTVSQSRELLFDGDNPVTITLNQGEDVFEPLKLLSCTISIVVNDYIPAFYSSITNMVSVKVYNLNTDTVHFIGYLTPEVYSQPFIGNDVLELECVSSISMLENYPYTTIEDSEKIQSLDDIVSHILSKTGVYTLDDFGKLSGYYYVFGQNYQLYENNFFDDDDEHTPWTCKDVLEQIFRFFGVSLVERNDRLYVVDYLERSEGAIEQNIMFDNNNHENITFAGSDTTLSLDNTYQKITIVDNQYPVSNNITTEDMVASAKVIEIPNKDYPQSGTDYDSSGGTLTQILDNTFVLQLTAWGSNKKNWSFLSLYDNPATCKSFYYPDSGWYMENEAQELPSSLNYKTLQNCTTGILCKVYNKEVENWYDVVESVKLSPALLLTSHATGSGNGLSELAFNGFQPLYRYTDYVRRVTTGKRKYLYMNFKCNFNYVNKHTGKLTGGDTPDSSDILDTPPRICTNIRITKTNGDVWFIISNGLNADSYSLSSTSGKWNGNNFSTQGGSFSPDWKGKNHENPDGEYHKRNNNGIARFIWVKENTVNEYDQVMLNEKHNGNNHTCNRLFIYPDWQTGTSYVNGEIGLLSNINWTYGIDKTNGFVIPIDKFELDNGDRVEITFYKPATIGSGNVLDCVLLTDLEIDILEENADKIENGDERSDVIYTNTNNIYNANGTYIGEYSDIELKINTQQFDMPQSYSSVLQNGLHVDKMIDPTIGNENYVQEQNLIEKYLRHFGTPKVLLSTTQNFLPSPIRKYNYMGKSFLLDGYEFDVKYDTTQLNIFEY